MVAHTFNHSVQEAEADRSLSSRPAWLYHKFESSQGSLVRPCLKKRGRMEGIPFLGACCPALTLFPVLYCFIQRASLPYHFLFMCLSFWIGFVLRETFAVKPRLPSDWLSPCLSACQVLIFQMATVTSASQRQICHRGYSLKLVHMMVM